MSHSNVCYGLMGLVSDLLLRCHPVARSVGSRKPWPVVRLCTWMQPGSGGGEDPREEHGMVAAAQDHVIWKMP